MHCTHIIAACHRLNVLEDERILGVDGPRLREQGLRPGLVAVLPGFGCLLDQLGEPVLAGY